MGKYYPFAARDLRDPFRVGRSAREVAQQGLDAHSPATQSVWENPGTEVFVRKENDVRRPRRSVQPLQSGTGAIGIRPLSQRWFPRY